MLVLSRKPGEKIVIGGGIVIHVGEAAGGRVRIGIEAPCAVPVLRGELVDTEVAAFRRQWDAPADGAGRSLIVNSKR
jgi:carbon storage regulator